MPSQQLTPREEKPRGFDTHSLTARLNAVLVRVDANGLPEVTPDKMTVIQQIINSNFGYEQVRETFSKWLSPGIVDVVERYELFKEVFLAHFHFPSNRGEAEDYIKLIFPIPDEMAVSSIEERVDGVIDNFVLGGNLDQLDAYLLSCSEVMTHIGIAGDPITHDLSRFIRMIARVIGLKSLFEDTFEPPENMKLARAILIVHLFEIAKIATNLPLKEVIDRIDSALLTQSALADGVVPSDVYQGESLMSQLLGDSDAPPLKQLLTMLAAAVYPDESEQ